jgi:hypothetical protein
MRWPRHPIHGLPFDEPLRNELRLEFERLPWRKRAGLLRKALQRELLLLVTGQTWLRVARAPANIRRMLWIYNWGTVGDSLMDLAVRRTMPADVQLDLVIAAPLAPLFANDPQFARVYTCIQDCRGGYDFVLLQDVGTGCVMMKLRSAFGAPFATVFGHLRGERFDRMSLAQRRFEQLFGWPAGPVQRQWLALGPRPAGHNSRTRVAVALGARDPRRWYRHWPAVLQALLARWPSARPTPEFVLIGNQSALADLGRFPPEFVAAHCRVEVDRHDLRGVADLIHGCDAFLGADGGLMHLAVACDLPGLALFVDIDPATRLLPGTRLQSLFADAAIGDLAPERVADRWLQALCDEAQADLRTTASICASAAPWL